MDSTLFLKRKGDHLLLAHVYVDDIIFGATNPGLCEEFSELTKSEFEMSMIGEPNFFLGLHIKQGSDGTMIHQQKYIKDILKRFDMKLSLLILPCLLQLNWI